MALPKTHLLLSLGLLAACQGFCAPTFAQASGNIFRYIDSDGRQVFNSHIPAEYVRNGYTVLNARGQVLEVVPRARTEAEIAAQQAAAAEAKLAAEAKEKQEEADQLLVRLYRSPEEIEHKRDNMLVPLNAQIGLLQGNLAKATQSMTESQTVVDNYSKANKEPPADFAARAARAREEIASIESRLTALLADRTRIIVEAERDGARLRRLLGAAEQSPAQ